MWINSCIIIYSFCQDHELEIHEDWLKDVVQWKHEQRIDLDEVKKEDRKMTLRNSQEKKVLHRGNIMRERLKYDLLETLKSEIQQ